MFGLFGKSKTVGVIAKVDFSGAGRNAGQLAIRLGTGEDFYVFMDLPRERIFEIFNLACAAMWDEKRVEITHTRRSGVNALKEIRLV